jgi:hypothetical protein
MVHSAVYSARARCRLIVETRLILLDIPMLLTASYPSSARLLPMLFDQPKATEHHTRSSIQIANHSTWQ